MTLIYKYIGCLAVFLGTVLCSTPLFAQQLSDSLFSNDARFHADLEERVAKAFLEQKGKTVPQLQLEAKDLKNEQKLAWKPKTKPLQQILPVDQVYQHAKSAVYLMGRLNQSEPAMGGYADLFATAFAISEDGICMTNYHVLSELISTNKPIDSLKRSTEQSTYFIQSIQGEVFVLEKLLAYSSSNDLAIFKVRTANKKLPHLPLGPVLIPGQNVYIISHPDHNYYYLSAGIVNKNSLMLNPRVPNIRQYRMTVSADYAIGSSGAPIISDKGNLAGIVSSTQTVPANASNGSNQQMVFKNAISVQAIHQLIE